jgi:oligopeptide transport system substrate-binding protein
MMHRVRAVTAAVVAAALLVACSQEVKLKPLPAGVREGGRLTVGILAPRAVAPWLTSTLDPYGSLIVSTMCDQIVDLDPTTGAMVPSIGTSWRHQSAAELIVKLRKGLVFPDGSKVSSDDVQESLARAARSELASPVGGVLSIVAGSEVLGELPTQESDDPRLRERLSGISAPAPNAIDVVLQFKHPDGFRFLAHPVASVVPSRAFRANPGQLERQPVCVGPYTLEEPWAPGQASIHLRRSAHYLPTDTAYTVGGRGLVDSIEFRVFPDRDGILAAYEAGQLDVGFLPPAGVAGARSRLGDAVVDAASPTLELIGLPINKAPFDRSDVRAALSLALDRQAVAATVPGALRPLTRFLPSTLGDAYGKTDKGSCPAVAKPTADLPAARKALQDAKVDLTGQTLRIAFNDEFDNRAIVEVVAKQWEAGLGIHVELVPTPWTAMLDAATSNAGLADPFRLSWSPEVPEPVSYLRPLFVSSLIGATNWSHFAVRRFDQLVLEKAEGTVDEKERIGSYLAAENILCSSMPMIPVAQGGFAYAVRQQRIGSAAGRFTDRATGALLLRDVYVKA